MANRIGPEQGRDGSPSVNQMGPEFEMSVVWGARPHPFRTGGLLVNRCPPLRSPRISPVVRRLGRLTRCVGPARESRLLPDHV
jgi:hypothetical protein